MDKLLNDCTPFQDIETFETKYHSEIKLEGTATVDTEFQYAFCLVHSKYSNDIKKGIAILEHLASTYTEGKRDYVYYLAFGNARIKNYDESLKYCGAFLEIEPNEQVKMLEEYVKEQSKKDLVKGVAVASTAAVVIGGLLGIAFSLLRR